MHKYITHVSFVAAAMILGGCVVPLSPQTSQNRLVSTVTSQTNLVIFKEPMVWSDRALFPTKGIRFPDGTYRIESEDSEYRYFRAPSKIEYRVFQDGKVTDDRFMPGGLFLSKRTFDLVPAGAYLFVDEHTNVLTWKLGADFLQMEGRKWSKNF